MSNSITSASIFDVPACQEEVYDGTGDQVGSSQANDPSEMDKVEQMVTKLFQDWDAAGAGIMRVSTIMLTLQQSDLRSDMLIALETLLDPHNDDQTVDREALVKAVKYCLEFKPNQLDDELEPDRSITSKSSDVDDDIEELRHQRIRDEQAINRLTSQLEASEERQNALYAEIRSLKEKNDRQEVELRQLSIEKSYCEDLQAAIDKKEVEITVLKESLNCQQFEVDSLREQNKRLINKLDEYKAKSDEFQKRLDASNTKKLQQEDNKICRLNEALENSNVRVAALTGEVEMIVQLNDELLLKVEAMKNNEEILIEKIAKLNYKLLMKKQAPLTEVEDIKLETEAYSEEMASTSPPCFPSPTSENSLLAEITSASKDKTVSEFTPGYVDDQESQNTVKTNDVSTQTMSYSRKTFRSFKRKLIIDYGVPTSPTIPISEGMHLGTGDGHQINFKLPDSNNNENVTTDADPVGLQLTDWPSSDSDDDLQVTDPKKTQLVTAATQTNEDQDLDITSMSRKAWNDSLLMTESCIQVGASVSDFLSVSSQCEYVQTQNDSTQTVVLTQLVTAATQTDQDQDSDITLMSGKAWNDSLLVTESCIQVGASVSDFLSVSSQCEYLKTQNDSTQTVVLMQLVTAVTQTDQDQDQDLDITLMSGKAWNDSLLVTESCIQVGASVSDFVSVSSQCEYVQTQNDSTQTSKLQKTERSVNQTERSMKKARVSQKQCITLTSCYFFGLFIGLFVCGFVFVVLIFTGTINDYVVEEYLRNNYNFRYEGLPPM